MSDGSLPPSVIEAAAQRLRAAQEKLAARYPGDAGARQPVHTVYGGAHLFHAGVVEEHGELASRALAEHAPDPATLADIAGLPAEIAEPVYQRVVAKLQREPVEDFRIDFEDGYGVRDDAEEDGHARAAAEAVATGKMPPFIGLRTKSLSAELGRRALRTIDLFVTTLVSRRGGLPPGFVITLPKVQSAEQVAVCADVLDALEARLGLSPGALRLEIMVETPQTVLGPDGRVLLPALLDAARGRMLGAHLGTYDYTLGCDVTAAHQRMRHPACEHAKALMKVAYAGTGLWLSDGSTNLLPLGDRAAVHAAWRLHAADIHHSLVGGFYQGWDLHAAQLPTRFAAVYGFYLQGLPAAADRLRGFLERIAPATLVAEVFDDAATGQALLGFVLRGLSCGALTGEEVVRTGLTPSELATRSFLQITRSRAATRSSSMANRPRPLGR